jgi:TIR domain
MVAQTPNLRIFCAYASEDRSFFHKLEQALGIHRHQGLTLWHHGELLPGSEWDSEIRQRLHAADVILLLISPAFLHSEYSWNKEIQWAMTRHASGDACVVPIILKPTPDWEKTPLGQLQALPTGMKPITTWRNRDEAFKSVVEGIGKVIQQVLQEERYAVQGYLAELRPSIYEDQAGAAAQEMAKDRAEQWIEEVHSRTESTLEEVASEENRREWILTCQQEFCHIALQWNYRGMDRDRRYFRSADITLTTSDLALLDRLIKVGQLSYWLFQWTLVDDLDIAKLAAQVHDQIGRGSASSTKAGIFAHDEYRMYDDGEHSVRATFSSKFAQSPARTCLVHDGLPHTGFYHAHELFSIRKILLALRGEISYRQIGQLIEKACTLDVG